MEQLRYSSVWIKQKRANIFMAGGTATLFFSLDKTKSANTLMVGGAATLFFSLNKTKTCQYFYGGWSGYAPIHLS